VNALRRGLMTAGGPVRVALIGLIRTYRVTLSGLLGGQCRFQPSCSAYAEGAIETHGAVRGTLLAMWRILRCNPFGRPGLDPLPPNHHAYDDVVPVAPPVTEARV